MRAPALDRAPERHLCSVGCHVIPESDFEEASASRVCARVGRQTPNASFWPEWWQQRLRRRAGIKVHKFAYLSTYERTSRHRQFIPARGLSDGGAAGARWTAHEFVLLAYRGKGAKEFALDLAERKAHHVAHWLRVQADNPERKFRRTWSTTARPRLPHLLADGDRAPAARHSRLGNQVMRSA